MKALATAALAAIVLLFSIDATAAPQPPGGEKPSSFAPRHTGRRVFGAPIQPPIVGAQKRAHHAAKPGMKAEKKKAKKPAAKPNTKPKHVVPNTAAKG